MKNYFHTILLITISCQVVLTITGDFTGEQNKKMLRFLCGCIVLLTLFSPIKSFIQHMETALDELLINMDGGFVSSSSDQSLTIYDSAYQYIAQNWLQYITDTYDTDPAQITMVLITDEENMLEEIQVFIKSCPYTVRRQIEKELQKKISDMQKEVIVSVYGE